MTVVGILILIHTATLMITGFILVELRSLIRRVGRLESHGRVQFNAKEHTADYE